MRLVLFFLLVLSVLCMYQTIEQKCIEKPIYELSENGKGKIVGSIEVKEQGKGIAIHVVASGLKPGQYGFHMHEKNTMSNTTDDKGNTVIGGGLVDTGIRIIRINMQVLMGMDIGEIWKCYKSGKREQSIKP